MKRNEYPSQEEIAEIFYYSDGNLYKRKTRKDFVGKPVGSKMRGGWSQVKINGIFYYVHMLIWVYHYGPVDEAYIVIHKDGDYSNNHIENLELTLRGNLKREMNYYRKRQNRTSKYFGVSRVMRKPNKKKIKSERKNWRATFNHKGISYNLGTFHNEEDAAMAYDNKAKEMLGSNVKFLNFPDLET